MGITHDARSVDATRAGRVMSGAVKLNWSFDLIQHQS